MCFVCLHVCFIFFTKFEASESQAQAVSIHNPATCMPQNRLFWLSEERIKGNTFHLLPKRHYMIYQEMAGYSVIIITFKISIYF